MKKYLIIDNFLKKNHFDKLSNLNLSFTDCNNLSVYKNKIDKYLKIKSDILNKDLMIELHNSYTKIGLNILEQLEPKKLKLFDYSEFTIIETGKDYVFPIHRDIPTKLLSGVIYLSPKNNLGTYVYSDKRGTNKEEIQWRKNRAFFFSRSEENSWHSYQGDNISNRIVLSFNLMTNDLKKACELENLNYYKIKFRERINPILYRYFKIIIN